MRFRIFLSGLISVLSISCYAATPIECPTKISVTESTPSHGNWSGYKRTVVKLLKESQIYAGNLGDERFLQAPAESSKNNQLIQLWDLKGNGSKQSYWIQCHYAGTDVSIRRKIPFTLKQCLRLFQRDKNHNAISGMNTICR